MEILAQVQMLSHITFISELAVLVAVIKIAARRWWLSTSFSSARLFSYCFTWSALTECQSRSYALLCRQNPWEGGTLGIVAELSCVYLRVVDLFELVKDLAVQSYEFGLEVYRNADDFHGIECLRVYLLDARLQSRRQPRVVLAYL